MYTYNRPKTAAYLDVYSKWRAIVEKHRKEQDEEMADLLQEMAKYLKSEGMVLDVKKSWIGTQPAGSDGVRVEGGLWIAEAKENTIQVHTPRQMEKWVQEAIGLSGSAKKMGEGPTLRQVDDKPVGIWFVDITAS